MFDGTSLLAAWFCSASNATQVAFTGLFSLRRLYERNLAPSWVPSPMNMLAIQSSVRGAWESLLKALRTYTQVSTFGQDPTDNVDVDDVLKRTLLNLEIAIKESGATISSTPLPSVRMYEFQLEQVFQNLIANAIRYRSDMPPSIRIAAKRQGEEWLFSVQDNGIGIESQFRERIFGIFKRLHSDGEYTGTGMGLAICQRCY
jgi:light-regulated signal transduction histidine kinase (bacteriophytochrome)